VPTRIWELDGFEEILYGGMVSDLIRFSKLIRDYESCYLGKRRLQKVFNKRGQIICFGEKHLFPNVISPSLSIILLQ